MRQNLQIVTNAVVAEPLRQQRNALDGQIKTRDDGFRRLLRGKAKTDPRVEALAAEYGVGFVLLATRFAYFDEIGALGRKRAAGLPDTAPTPARRFPRQTLHPRRTGHRPPSALRLLHGLFDERPPPIYDVLRAIVRRLIVHLDTVAQKRPQKHR